MLVSSAHAAATMFDPKKGSMTNRAECAKEHFKNDFKYGMAIGLPTAGVVATAAVARLKPNSSIMKKITSYAAKAANGLGKLFGKVTSKIAPKLSEKILKNPAKFGVIGLLAAGGVYVLNQVSKWANNAGRIDQKYEDAAKIEGTTKNVVLEG